MGDNDYAQSWLDLEESMGGSRFVLKGTAEEMRAQFDQLISIVLPLLPLPSDAVSTRDGDVNGIKYRIYIPREASKQGLLPVGVWTHGGGFVLGDLNSGDLLCRVLAEHTPSILVNIDYRLAPEHKAPTQLQDCLAVYKWAHENASQFGGDPNKFYTTGDSAGGCLALQIANQLVKDSSKRSNIRGVAALIPCTLHWDNVPEEYQSIYKSYEENGVNTPIIDKKSMEQFYEYTGLDPKDPNAFVALASDNHKNFPPTYFVSCGKDPLRDDAFVMEAALKKAGVPTKHDTYARLPHAFWAHPAVQEGQLFVGNLIGGIKWLVSQM